MDMILEVRKKIVQRRNGKLRMFTATDILRSEVVGMNGIAGTTLLCLETGVVCFSQFDMKGKQLDVTRNILGSPPSGLCKNYPFLDKESFSINSVESPKTRARILAMLDYYPENRILS